jgi:exopolyphosphatase/guanosine-5'-triphosphate,3'-diphosphate pyrophosphatase
MKLATIDIGSNSIHLLIVDVDEQGHFRPIDREREMVRLGSHGLTVGHLAPDAVERSLAALDRYADLAKAHGCRKVIATATSAVREADNGDKFLKRVKRRTGIEVEILTGLEEARLIARAVNYARDLGDARTLGIDIGGGSTEFWILHRGENKLLTSNKLGSVRLTDGFVKSDPLSKRDRERLRGFIIGSLVRTAREVEAVGFDQVIVTSGTAITLAQMANASVDHGNGRGPRPPLETEGLTLTAKDLRRIVKQAVKLPLRERQRIPGLPPERADIIVAGGILLDTIFDELKIRAAETCDWSLREGVLINYLEMRAGARPRRARPDGFELSETRLRSVLALARRCVLDPEHARQTARLAKSIFDQTASLHGLDRDARELLESAAILQEIGYFVSHTDHNLHAQYLIMNSELLGYSSRELSILGCIVRYQRSSGPRNSHEEYRRLRPQDKKLVQKLSAILRLAVALDRSSRSAVASVDVEIGKHRAAFRVTPTSDCSLEIWDANRKATLFEKVFNRKTTFELASQEAGPAPAAEAQDATQPA